MKRYFNFASILFNIIETILILGSAYFLKLTFINTLLVLLTFQICRLHFGLPKHYKDWQRCLIWTLMIFMSLFLLVRVDISISILSTIFASYILSGKGDIVDIYMWSKGKTSKYEKLDQYILYNGLSKELREIEEGLKAFDTQMYLLYLRRFKEHCTFEEMSEEFGLDNPRINELLDKIYTLMIFNLKI